VLERCYAIVAENRADLVEMVRATYANDVAVMERLRSRAARKGRRVTSRRLFRRAHVGGGETVNAVGRCAARAGRVMSVRDRATFDPEMGARVFRLSERRPA
jgi:hypothetical protein